MMFERKQIGRRGGLKKVFDQQQPMSEGISIRPAPASGSQFDVYEEVMMVSVALDLPMYIRAQVIDCVVRPPV